MATPEGSTSKNLSVWKFYNCKILFPYRLTSHSSTERYIRHARTNSRFSNGTCSRSGFSKNISTILDKKFFLATQYIRHSSKPFYTPEPDIIHEIVGHRASLAHPGIAEVNRLLGLASEVATESEMLRLARVYWYTLEIGLVQQFGEVKAFGAGLLSSVGELQGFSQKAQLQEWDLKIMMNTDYDPTTYQSILFVAPSFTRLLADTYVVGYAKECGEISPRTTRNENGSRQESIEENITISIPQLSRTISPPKGNNLFRIFTRV